MKIIVFFFLATLVATSSYAACLTNPIRLPGDMDLGDSNQIPNVLQPLSGSGCLYRTQVNCLSWHLAVETNNLIKWSTVPSHCVDYVANYMQGKQYRKDTELVADLALDYAESVEPTGDGKDIWILDLAETCISNLPYYARSDVAFGGFKYNSTKFNQWVAKGEAPAVPAVLRLYKKLHELGFKVVFLTGSHEYQREALTSNLKRAGYTTWEKFILKGNDDSGLSGAAFKSKKRTELVEKEGYRIVGNVGDQWNDLTGKNVGERTFKIPNPMYYA